MFTKIDTFSKTKGYMLVKWNTLCWVHPDEDSLAAKVDAVWFKEVKGVLEIRGGVIHGHVSPAPEKNPTRQNFESAKFHWDIEEYRWDGTNIKTKVTDFATISAAVALLDPILDTFKKDQSIHAGYDGWYKIKS